MKFEALRLMRILFEVRFHASFFYEDQRKGIFQELTEKFPEIRMNPGTIEVSNPKEHFKVFAEWNRAGSSMEDVTNFANFRDETHNFISKLYEAFKIKQTIRTGIRFFYVIASPDSYIDLKKELAESCYQEKVLKVWGDKYNDMALVLVYENGENIYHLTVGAVQGDELIQRCGFEYDIADIPERGVLFDIDYYNLAFEKPFAKNFINRAHQLIESKINEFGNLIEK